MREPAIGVLGSAEMDQIMEWAAAEGWNPGLHDSACFRSVDAGGFLGLFEGDQLVSAISAIRYEVDFGFIGFYLCRPDVRGMGFGRRIWNAGLGRLNGRTVGLDGVVAQQANYRREGFVFAHRSIRYSGPSPSAAMLDPAVLELGAHASSDLVEAILDYDRRHFPACRDRFVRCWIKPLGRRAVLYLSDGKLCGYGVLRACRVGYKIGPLFADNETVADALFNALIAPNYAAPIALDVPEPNGSAIRLAERYGMAPVFETARMYRGAPPKLPLERIFGNTTFELG